MTDSTRFADLPHVAFEGPDTDNLLAYRYYQPDRMVLGKTMAAHLRIAVCWWHSFCWPGTDPFGAATIDRPWFLGDPLTAADAKLAAGFAFVQALGVPYFTFHDRDVAPEGASFGESAGNLDRMAEHIQAKMEETGIKLLWGTANLFSHPRYMAGAATNPDPEVFAYACAQVAHAMEVTKRLGGENYVLWGGREGYDTLLNTDLKRESDQLGRFLTMVVEHKHKIGFSGTILIEPKPMEPTKHQYDRDVATVYAFLQRHGLQNEVKVNIEANHATLAGHSFEHEIATAAACGLFGSIDINRGDPQNGWDTDQFPNDPLGAMLALYEMLKAGGFTTGGFNFDAKVRRQSIDPLDLLQAHVGGIDTLARGLLAAARLMEDGRLERLRAERYAGWDGELGQRILSGGVSLNQMADWVVKQGVEPKPRSGRQEMLETLVGRFI